MSIISCALASEKKDFLVHKFQQFDIQGLPFGSRSSEINNEVRTLNSESYQKKCVLLRLFDFTIEKYRSLVSQSIVAIVVILPQFYEKNDIEVL